VNHQVKAEEDLYLTGAENTIRRVTAETNYSCLMLKTQRFSSLFRHYAKYHGLRKDDLEYYFVNLLENEDTPESVQLQRGDTIMVRKRRKPEPPQPAADDDEFFKDMRELLHDEEHMDCTFVFENDADDDDDDDDDNMNARSGAGSLKAHRAIITARSEYFQALFRNGQFREGKTCVVRVEGALFDVKHVRYALEFLYTNRIEELRTIPTDDLLCLLHLSDKWQLRDLKRLVEFELVRDHMNVDNVARLYGATEDFCAQRLSRACIEYIMANLRQLAGNTAFEEEMKNYPHLCIPVLKAAADLIPQGPPTKKQRISNANADAGTPSSAAALAGSSPVPDSDT